MIKQDDIALTLERWRPVDPQAQRCGGESKWKTYVPTAWLSLVWSGRMGVRESGCQGMWGSEGGEGAGSVNEVKTCGSGRGRDLKRADKPSSRALSLWAEWVRIQRVARGRDREEEASVSAALSINQGKGSESN